jgi:hypothetical protein
MFLNQKDKVDEHFVKGILVGINKGKKSYKCYILALKKVVTFIRMYS